MGKKLYLFGVLTILAFMMSSCDEDKSLEGDKNTMEQCNCIMDTLKGEWSWVKTHGGMGGNIIDNEFKSTLKILSQNENSSINYQVFVDDTLFYEGSFQIHNNELSRYAHIKLPHNNVMGDWMFTFRDWNIEYIDGAFVNRITEDVLCLFDGAVGGYQYYYKKIK